MRSSELERQLKLPQSWEKHKTILHQRAGTSKGAAETFKIINQLAIPTSLKQLNELSESWCDWISIRTFDEILEWTNPNLAGLPIILLTSWYIGLKAAIPLLLLAAFFNVIATIYIGVAAVKALRAVRQSPRVYLKPEQQFRNILRCATTCLVLMFIILVAAPIAISTQTIASMLVVSAAYMFVALICVRFISRNTVATLRELARFIANVEDDTLPEPSASKNLSGPISAASD